jgi:hypothetical protein
MSNAMRVGLMLLPLLLMGCNYNGWDRKGTWTVPADGLDSNDSNLRVMLVNPGDLTRGTGESTSEGTLASRPVQMLLSGQRQALPSVNASTISANQSQPSTGTGGAGVGPQQ